MEDDDMAPTSNDLATFGYKIGNLEKQMELLRNQMHLYVPVRENELRLAGIQDSVRRMEVDIQDIRRQFHELAIRMGEQDAEAKRRDIEQREAQDKLQIRFLYGIVTIVITILSAVVIAYLTHLIK